MDPADVEANVEEEEIDVEEDDVDVEEEDVIGVSEKIWPNTP